MIPSGMPLRSGDRNQIVGLLCAVATLALAGCSSEPLPETFGFYLVDGTELYRLEQFTDLGRTGQVGHAIYGLKSKPDLETENAGVYFVLYDQDANRRIADLEISELGFEGDRVIDGVWGKTNVKIKMYTHRQSKDFDVAPLDDAGRMFKIVPRAPLEPGLYAIHNGDLREQGFGLEEVACYAFRIRSQQSAATRQGSADLSAWTLAFYFELDLSGEDESELGPVWTLPAGSRIVAGRDQTGKIVTLVVDEAGAEYLRNLRGLQVRAELSVRVRSWRNVPRSGAICRLRCVDPLTTDTVDCLDDVLSAMQVEAAVMLVSADKRELTMILDRLSWDDMPRLHDALGEFDVHRINDWQALQPKSEG